MPDDKHDDVADALHAMMSGQVSPDDDAMPEETSETVGEIAPAKPSGVVQRGRPAAPPPPVNANRPPAPAVLPGAPRPVAPPLSGAPARPAAPPLVATRRSRPDAPAAPPHDPTARPQNPLPAQAAMATPPRSAMAERPAAPTSLESAFQRADFAEPSDSQDGLEAQEGEMFAPPPPSAPAYARTGTVQAVGAVASLHFKQTLIPPLLTCAVMFLAVGLFHFVLGPDSFLGVLSTAYSVGVGIFGAVLLVLALVIMNQVRHQITGDSRISRR